MPSFDTFLSWYVNQMSFGNLVDQNYVIVSKFDLYDIFATGCDGTIDIFS